MWKPRYIRNDRRTDGREEAKRHFLRPKMCLLSSMVYVRLSPEPLELSSGNLLLEDLAKKCPHELILVRIEQ
jgi:hypothetical protein